MQVQAYMTENGIEIKDYSSVGLDVSLLGSGKLKSNAAHGVEENGKDVTGHVENAAEETKNNRIWIDPNSCSLALYSKLAADQVFMQPSPLAIAKAVKV